MKYKVGGIALALAMILCALIAGTMDWDKGNNRVHQHLTARQPDAGCDCDGSELCTHLPLVIIDTGGEDIPGVPVTEQYEGDEPVTLTSTGESMLSVKVSVLDDDTRNHHPSDTPDLESEALVRVRGNSSRYFDKKSYLIRFTDTDGSYADHEVMGMEAHYEWALYGPYLDKSLIRNYMWYNIAGEIMDYAPNVRFCEVIINGEYQGLYLMTETITNGEDSRVNVSEPIENTTATGYVLRMDRGSNTAVKNINNFTYYTYRIDRLHGIMINIVYPRSGDLTQEMADAIEQELSDFEKTIYSYDYDSYLHGYQTWIDVDSFVDYFILNEFTANYDAGTLSTYLYKDISEAYKLCIWDFNSACDNYVQSTTSPQHFEMQDTVWYFMLTKDEAFVKRIINRYHMLRKHWLSDEYIENYIDETIAYLGDAVDRNFEVWGYTFEEYQPLEPEERNPGSYEEAVQQLKDFCFERGAWMDENIDILQQYSHLSKNKKFNH